VSCTTRGPAYAASRPSSVLVVTRVSVRDRQLSFVERAGHLVSMNQHGQLAGTAKRNCAVSSLGIAWNW
jgi:hypothetical protein